MELNSITSILNTLEREVRVMARDLKADLELCKNSAPIEFIYQSREGWPEAINRAMAAEKMLREIVELLNDDNTDQLSKIHEFKLWNISAVAYLNRLEGLE
jgi:hypothetical protein